MDIIERRIDRIYQFVKDHQHVSTAEVAEILNIQRSNASKDLNKLVKSGLLHKTATRPVNYFTSNKSISVSDGVNEFTPLTDDEPHAAVPVESGAALGRDIFSQIIGSTGSMRNAVDQAKAAILYPPKGLNCLITGPTGSGKTFFAHAMFQFAKAQHIIAPDKELVVFNCADYANNSELLMSHLFGYVKGAFTGADSDKTGIIHEADGGMLFLDEIHRLPPVGQEMIFYFMDHGTFSRLGESGKNNAADVRIVAATTEDPSSALLDTFVRRIPITMKLPFFDARPAQEQIELVRVLVAMEANRIQRQIILSEDVVKALIGSVSYGNIGQLKSNVQLICARGFMNHMSQAIISIGLNDLTENIKAGLIQLTANRVKSGDVAAFLEPEMIVTPNEINQLIKADPYELPYNLYDIIGDKAKLLREEGLDQDKINHFISTDINVHLKSFYKDHGFTFDTRARLVEFVDEAVIEVSNQIAYIVSQRLQQKLQPNFIYAMSLHLSALLKKIHLGETRSSNANIYEMAQDYPQERLLAREVRTLVEETFQVKIPESEDNYLTVLLVSLRENQTVGQVGIIVAAHGNSTATSMVQVVRELLDATNLLAIDMPLDMHPRAAFEKICAAVTTVDEGSGVLLLVDMGSLASFNEELQNTTGSLVRTLDMVTTPLVIEAARKASTIGTDADELYDSLLDFRGYEKIAEQFISTNDKPQAILAICASGEGTAVRLKEMIENSLSPKRRKKLAVITLSVADLKTEIPQIAKEYNIIATTGITKSHLKVPHIPMEKIINQQADEVLDELLLDNDLETQQDLPLTVQKAKEVCLNFMEESYTFINPKKLLLPLWEMATDLLGNTDAAKENADKVNFVMHMAGVVERSVLKQPLQQAEETFTGDAIDAMQTEKLNTEIDKLEQQLNILIPDAERYYIEQFLNKGISV